MAGEGKKKKKKTHSEVLQFNLYLNRQVGKNFSDTMWVWNLKSPFSSS